MRTENEDAKMSLLLDLIKAVAVLVAAGILGNWFLREVRAGKEKGLPWYAPYKSPLGLLIICIALLLPVLAWWLNR